MGYSGMQQTAVIVKESSKWWIPIAVAVITLVGGIITALIRRKK